MPDRRAAARKEGAALRGIRVLIVEDEPVIALALEEILEAIGCTVVGIATAVPQALRLIAEAPPQLAVLDVNLHGARSYPVADALSERGIGFVFATGYGDSDHPDRYRSLPTVTKPYKPEDIRAALAVAAAAE